MLFVDFDDTLVVGPISWGMRHVIPDMVKHHQLSFDPIVFERASIQAQQDGASSIDESEILDKLFASMGWPAHLKQALVKQVFEGYTPVLFDDALPFLQRQSKAGDAVYLLSNNNYAPHIAQKLGIASYLCDVFTPKICGAARGKPFVDLWQYVTGKCTIDRAVVIGDDPWSDGAFADALSLSCTIVDRLNRFGFLKYNRVTSLDEL